MLHVLGGSFIQAGIRMRRISLMLFLALTACSGERVQPLSAEAAHVHRIDAGQGLLCTYLSSVDYSAHLKGFDKSDAEIREAGEHGLRNLVAQAGGNAYVMTRQDVETFRGRVDYSGQVFKCADVPSNASH